MNDTIKFEDFMEMYDKMKMNTSDSYGLLCSGSTKELLTKHCEEISNQSVRELMTIYGLKIQAIPYWPDDLLWLLNKRDFEGVLENGLIPLMERMSRVKVFQL